MSACAIALAWYSPEEWQKLRDTAADRDSLNDSYLEWFTEATKTYQSLTELGSRVERVAVRMDELNAWCQRNGVPNTSASRSHFVAEVARKRAGRFPRFEA